MGGFAGILLGLTLAACTADPGTEDESTSVADGTSNGTTADPSATSTTNQATSLGDATFGEEEADVAAYAGPGSFTDTFPDDTTGPPDTDTDSTSGSGSESGSGSGSGGTGGSDSGSSSGNG